MKRIHLPPRQINHFDSDRFTAYGDYFNSPKDDGQTQWDCVDNSEDESYDELVFSQQLECM